MTWPRILWLPPGILRFTAGVRYLKKVAVRGSAPCFSISGQRGICSGSDYGVLPLSDGIGGKQHTS